MNTRMAVIRTLLLVAMARGAYATDAAILQLDKVWSPVGGKGVDLPVYMTISNPGEADDILRIDCPSVAHFTEKRAVDHGEGAPAAREVRAIPVKAQGDTTLQPGGYHLSLLKIIDAVKAGDAFDCQISFRRSGVRRVQVSVIDTNPEQKAQ